MSDYIDKKEMYEELLAYKKKCVDAENSGNEVPMVPNSLGSKFMDISTNIARRPNFSGYPFKGDMINDGIENCLRAVHNFDPEKGNNPFGYFSQIIWFAFLRRIEKEKKELYTKHKYAEQCVVFGQDVDVKAGDQSGDGFLKLDNEYMNDFVETFEKKKRDKKKVANSGIDEYLD